jgi:8-oxo-dGTP pyrophosphatase MutT (NUDIX family)
MDRIAHSTAMGSRPSAKVLAPLSARRRQAAAVCYRIDNDNAKRGIEFLLVQTRGGRWIFPKGGVEPGLTSAQSAALEAFEEAGVHGRIEAISFTRYFRWKPARATTSKSAHSAAHSAHADFAVAAHLCEVSRLETPQESNRNPTWFSAEKAQQRLRKDRPKEFGTELARVVEHAVSRIQRLHNASRRAPDRGFVDGLQKVRFEAHRFEPHEDGRINNDELRKAVLARYFLRPSDAAPEEIRPVLRLGAGTGSSAEPAHNITAIDGGRRENLSKPGSVRSGNVKAPGKPAGGRA